MKTLFKLLNIQGQLSQHIICFILLYHSTNFLDIKRSRQSIVRSRIILKLQNGIIEIEIGKIKGHEY